MGALITTPITVVLSIISSRSSDLEFWCKWIISYVSIELFRRRARKRFDLYDMLAEHDPYKVGFLPPPEEIVLESPLPEEHLFNLDDEVFFYGMNSKSESFSVRISRKPENESNAWIRLRLADGRSYEMNETSGFQQSGCDKMVFSCGDLQMHYISPMRRWRIFFNGLMEENCIGSKYSKKMVQVKFVLLWQASSKIFDFTTDVSTKALASGLARAKWNQYLPPLKKLYSAMNIYVQTGAINGNVTIGEDQDYYNIYLFGEKLRLLGYIPTEKSLDIIQILGRTEKDGRFFHLVQTSLPNIVQNLQFGFVVQPNGDIENISDEVNIVKNLIDKGKFKDFETEFHAGGELCELNCAVIDEEAHFEDNSDWGEYIDLQLNCLKGKGIVLKREIKNTRRRSVPKEPTQYSTEVPYVVQFSDKMCQDSEITGGKGSSLGKLTELSKKFQTFTVSDGMVVTTAAYEKFMTREALQEIESLEKIIYNDKFTDIIEACQKVVEKVVELSVPENIQRDIVALLQKLFPDRENTISFAVRSSATGEDAEHMSAAGQMETYLGVTSVDEIITAVKKCWASQFSHIAVQYKRQNGQLLNSPMAVVIQQMVSCDVAGVLFTCDPLTGNPTRISLTANYGLGESVVSGSEEPDILELARIENDKLVVKRKILGSKRRRIVIKEDEGANLEDVPDHERESFCLTDEMALQLGDLAIKIQNSYRSHRDIEWGFWNNNLYIFQSRPVTSGTRETDFEIDHESDAALRIENEYFTVCNVGEIVPGAMSPLGLEIILKFISIVFQGRRLIPFQQKPTIYFPFIWCSMYNHIMFNCVNLFKRIKNKDVFNGLRLALFGRLLEEEELFEIARWRHKNENFPFSLKMVFETLYKIFYLPRSLLKKCQKTYVDYRIPIEECKTSQELFDLLMYSCTDLNEVYACHMVCSETSSTLNMKTLSVLSSARGELSSEVYADFSKLLKTCSDVESADVPAALEELSLHISNDIKPQVFKLMNPNEALTWLQSSKLKSGVKYREFLSKHGHRCLRELEIRSSTWQTDPSSLIRTLQNIVGNIRGEKNENSGEEFDTLVSKLHTQLDFKKRLLLKILIPMSQKAVQRRECSKSLFIRGVDAWRKGYTRLSQMMASEGRIPDSDLLFYMTLEEIKELIHSRSPKIITRANHRRRRYPILDQYIFPEISKGFPIPVNFDAHTIITTDEDVSMKGIPVSQGVTKGFVRVAITLEEASFLQAGEILVTYSTDIGWTPYFPILSGVATELGGLISHGAVVSREYGLPCVAGLHGATRQFQTGDYAVLDGNKGILKKLSKQENL